MTTAAQRRSLRKPGKLHRVLTSYVATKVTVDHPASPKVETPCRWGTMVGFALVDEQFGYGSGGARELTGYHVNLPADPVSGGYYSDGDTPISFQQNEWVAPVYNAGTAAARWSLGLLLRRSPGPSWGCQLSSGRRSDHRHQDCFCRSAQGIDDCYDRSGCCDPSHSQPGCLFNLSRYENN